MGLRDEQTDPEFFQFESAKYGLRAMYKLLCNYQRLYKLDTAEKIITRWAPPNENDSNRYVKDVCSACGIHPDEIIDLRKNKALAVRFIAAMVLKENGEQPYSDEEIRAAMLLVG